MKCSKCGKEIGNNILCSRCGTINERQEETLKPSSSISEQDRLAMINEAKKAVTKIHVEFGQASASGSGWCTDDNYIITNAHVVTTENEEATSILCVFAEETGIKRKIPMKIVYASRRDDIAVLTPISGVLPSEIKRLEIARKDTQLGEYVFTIGNPRGLEFVFIDGRVSHRDYHDQDRQTPYNVLITSLSLNPGNSGGFVANTKGEVVGMATYFKRYQDARDALIASGEAIMQARIVTMQDIQSYGYCVKAEAILDAIEIANSKRK